MKTKDFEAIASILNETTATPEEICLFHNYLVQYPDFDSDKFIAGAMHNIIENAYAKVMTEMVGV